MIRRTLASKHEVRACVLSMNLMDTEIGVMGSFNYSGMWTQANKAGGRGRGGGEGVGWRQPFCRKLAIFGQNVASFWVYMLRNSAKSALIPPWEWSLTLMHVHRGDNGCTWWFQYFWSWIHTTSVVKTEGNNNCNLHLPQVSHNFYQWLTLQVFPQLRCWTAGH